ncbi:MAG TPA: hypothetical protein VK669_10845 [Candidatus Limnocylindrales bacterium]|nr:hypothetical protein [Candidatus Limnocylindrales bacterium]
MAAAREAKATRRHPPGAKTIFSVPLLRAGVHETDSTSSGRQATEKTRIPCASAEPNRQNVMGRLNATPPARGSSVAGRFEGRRPAPSSSEVPCSEIAEYETSRCAGASPCGVSRRSATSRSSPPIARTRSNNAPSGTTSGASYAR